MKTGTLGKLSAAFTLVFIISAARSAEACSVCVSASEETRQAYYGTTVLMMLLPFVLLGALIYWLRRAARTQQARLEQAQSISR